MKNMGIFNALLFCFLLVATLSFGQKGGDWQNRPLIKRSAQKKQATKDNKRSGNKNNKKTSELKKTLAWYKKPAAFYAAGGLASAALGAYAIFKYMQGEELVLVQEPDASSANCIEPKNKKHQNTDNAKIVKNDGIKNNNTSNSTMSAEGTKKPIESVDNVVVADEKSSRKVGDDFLYFAATLAGLGLVCWRFG